MIEHFLADQNLPFAVALVLMLGLAVIEGVGMLVGILLSNLVDSLLPDFDMDVDADLDAEIHDPGVAMQFLGWLCIGRVPVLIIFIVFLTAFGIAGMFMQTTIHGITGAYLPSIIASPIALLCALPVTRAGGLLFAKIMPKEETEAVSRDAFVGDTAIIIRGVATMGVPAEAKLTDRHGYRHYVLVEPDEEGESFPTGTTVILTERMGARFRAIRNTNPMLSDTDR
jgi:hypothetical protein